VEAAPKARGWQVEAQPDLAEIEEPAAPSLRVVGVLDGRYVVLEASDGLVLLEAEAARERIYYEQFLRGAEAGGAESQGLLVPVLLQLEARDADVVLRNAENFREAGMEVESFGGVSVQLRSLPALLANEDPKALLLDLVDEMVASSESRAGRTLAFEKFAGELAMVGARGKRCRVESAQSLLDQLFSCELPYCTPAGRPTIVQMSSGELARKFGRG
jgi:DNA mismatch repair protein MutL